MAQLPITLVNVGPMCISTLLWCLPAFVIAVQKPIKAGIPHDPVYAAIMRNHPAELEQALRKGADPNKPGPKGRAPILEATIRGPNAIFMVKVLLQAGARVDVTDEKGTSALIAAIRDSYNTSPQDVISMAAMFLDRGADIDYRAPDRETALSAALRTPQRSQVVRFLVKRGARIEDGAGGMPPLHFAALADQTERIRELLKAGASPNEPDARGRTPLMLASDGASLDTVAALLDSGAKASDQAFLIAMSAPEPDTAILLIKRGANVNAKDAHGNSALHIALHLWAFPHGVSQADYPVLYAQLAKIDTLIQALLDKGGNVNTLKGNQRTPLHEAVSRERNRIFKRKSWVGELLERGADPNAGSERYASPLIDAIDPQRPSDEIPRLLIEKGANVNANASESITILQSAMAQKDFALARLLVEKGAKVDVLDDARKTPLMWAAYHGQLDLSKLLKERGANIHAVDALGQTSLDLAVKGKHTDVADFLRGRGVKETVVPAPSRNTLGQVTVRFPLSILPDVESAGPVTYTTDERRNPPVLVVHRSGKPMAQPVSFAPLFTDRRLWTPKEHNDNAHNLNRGYLAATAYRFFGLVPAGDGAYLGVAWYSSGASVQNQIVNFVFQASLVGRELELTILRKGKPGYDPWYYSGGQLPRLMPATRGGVKLIDLPGTFIYRPDGTWERVGPGQRPKFEP